MSRSGTPSAAASRLRLPDTAAIISKPSAPTRLKCVAFGLASITAEIAERYWLLVHLDLADLGQPFDKMPQPELIEIDARAGVLLDGLYRHR
jgi:hypothetical protein